jgi:hypothetical protein
MKYFAVITIGISCALLQTPVYAEVLNDRAGYIRLADNDDRDERRDERGRSDERQDKRDCRQDEGRVGKDKRDCKQEEVRDGATGNR